MAGASAEDGCGSEHGSNEGLGGGDGDDRGDEWTAVDFLLFFSDDERAQPPGGVASAPPPGQAARATPQVHAASRTQNDAAHGVATPAAASARPSIMRRLLAALRRLAARA